MRRTDSTPGSASTGAVKQGPDREAAILGRIAFRDGRPFEPISLLFVVDASPPTTFLLGLPGWVPTLELTAYVRAEPVEGPLVFRQRSRLVQGGLIDELCDVWDDTGRLVAQASQLAAVRT